MSDAIDRLLDDSGDRQRDAPIIGLVYAEVTAITDEGYELNYLSLNQTEPSAPARCAAPMAGDKRGCFMRPEVGDEVVVGFEKGRIERPVILGSLWSDQDQPPTQADASETNNVRTIVSRAGQELTFDDSPGAQKIVIKVAGVEVVVDATNRKITISTTGTVATSRIVFDGIAWNHQHATGTGPSGPPVSIVPVT